MVIPINRQIDEDYCHHQDKSWQYTYIHRIHSTSYIDGCMDNIIHLSEKSKKNRVKYLGMVKKVGRLDNFFDKISGKTILGAVTSEELSRIGIGEGFVRGEIMKLAIGDSNQSVIVARCREGVFGTDHRSESDHAHGRRGLHQVRFAGGTFHPDDVGRIPALRTQVAQPSATL